MMIMIVLLFGYFVADPHKFSPYVAFVLAVVTAVLLLAYIPLAIWYIRADKALVEYIAQQEDQQIALSNGGTADARRNITLTESQMSTWPNSYVSGNSTLDNWPAEVELSDTLQ